MLARRESQGCSWPVPSLLSCAVRGARLYDSGSSAGTRSNGQRDYSSQERADAYVWYLQGGDGPATPCGRSLAQRVRSPNFALCEAQEITASIGKPRGPQFPASTMFLAFTNMFQS